MIFSAPSLGAFMPPVIKARKLDQANGLDITFQERTPDAYTAQFNSGEFKIGGSASLLTIALADIRGVKVKYLFNLFDFWGTVVTSRPEIKTLKDLEGKQLAGARATTNYVMFEFFAKKLGVDVSKIQVVNTATPGLVGYALADRADAVQIWEPAYTLLLSKKPDIRTLDLDIEKTWKAFAGGSRIPYLGVGAHADWADKNPALVAKLYATYKAAAEWIVKNPDEAAPLIAPGATADDVKAMASLIRSNERLAMSLVGANEVRKEIEAVYKAGIDVGYFPTMPSARLDLRQADSMIGNPHVVRALQATASTLGDRGGLAGRVVVFPALSVSAGARHRHADGRHPDHRPAARRGAGHGRAHLRRPLRRLRARLRAGAADRPLAAHRELRHAGAGVPAGHPGAVLGGDRDHLVPRHRVPHLLHHGDDHVAGLHVPDPRRLPLDVEGSVRDDHVVPAAALDACSRS